MRIGHLKRHTGMLKGLSVESTHTHFPLAELFTRRARRPDPHSSSATLAPVTALRKQLATILFRLLFVQECVFRRLSKPLPP